jgi:hypothetical protein
VTRVFPRRPYGRIAISKNEYEVLPSRPWVEWPMSALADNRSCTRCTPLRTAGDLVHVASAAETRMVMRRFGDCVNSSGVAIDPMRTRTPPYALGARGKMETNPMTEVVLRGQTGPFCCGVRDRPKTLTRKPTPREKQINDLFN